MISVINFSIIIAQKFVLMGQSSYSIIDYFVRDKGPSGIRASCILHYIMDEGDKNFRIFKICSFLFLN